jgi:hypothetical protein
MHACDCDEGSDHAARLVSLRRNSIQKDSEHFAPPSASTAIAMITATETMRPAWELIVDLAAQSPDLVFGHAGHANSVNRIVDRAGGRPEHRILVRQAICERYQATFLRNRSVFRDDADAECLRGGGLAASSTMLWPVYGATYPQDDGLAAAACACAGQACSAAVYVQQNNDRPRHVDGVLLDPAAAKIWLQLFPA